MGFSLSAVKQGAKNGAGVFAGRLLSRAVPDVTGISGMIAASNMSSMTATIALAAVQMVAGVLIGGLLKGFAGPEFGAYAIAGAFDGVYEDVATSALNTSTFPGKYLGGYSRPLNMASANAIRGYSGGGYAIPSGTPRNPGSAPLSGRVGPAALRRIGIGAAARVAR
jgi:hypothetical protein